MTPSGSTTITPFDQLSMRYDLFEIEERFGFIGVNNQRPLLGPQR